MFGQRLSALFGADHAGVVKDVLSGKERILSLGDIFRRYPCQTRSACHFAALNFVRIGFKHVQRRRTTRGSASASMAQWLSAMTEHRVLEEMSSPCERLSTQPSIQLEEMCRIPLFERTLEHVATRHGPPSMICFKQSLRQMQLNACPVTAMVVSRNASATVCLKLRENSKDVFFVLDFVLESSRGDATTLPLVISTSLEQTAARLSGVLPVDNRLVTRDRQWQAQLFTSSTICVFTPAEGVTLSPGAESLAINESITLLKAMGEIDDPEQERGADGDRHRREDNQPSGSSHRELAEGIPFGVGMISPTMSRGLVPAGGVSSRWSGERTSLRVEKLPLKSTFLPYEQTKRHCRIFFQDDESSASMSPSPSPISMISSTATSEEEGYLECVICFENISGEDGIHLLPCAHGFCKSCLAGHVCSKIEERRFPVFCPLCMTEQGNANPSVVSETVVQRIGVSEAVYMIWTELEIAHLCVRVQCHRCTRSALVDKEDYERLEKVSCPLPGCRHTWCKNCQQSISSDGPKHSCDGTKELDYLVKQMGWKYCPKCKTPVQKNGGCNHMTCASPGCNTHFCYRCGKQITRATIPFLVTSAVNTHFKQCTL